MNEDNAIGYIFGCIIALVATVYFLRLTFSLPRFLRYRRMELHLLIEIAKANGVTNERIEAITKSDNDL